MKRAFTLIELLVVIAIIAILAAILFPVFAQAKAAAKGSASLSNTKQISLGAIQYSADVDDMFMIAQVEHFGATAATAPSGSYTISGFTHTPWTRLVQPYMKNTDLFRDPLGPELPLFTAPSTQADRGIIGTEYGWNALGLSDFYGDVAMVPKSATAPADPAGTVMLTSKASWDEHGRTNSGASYGTWALWYNRVSMPPLYPYGAGRNWGKGGTFDTQITTIDGGRFTGAVALRASGNIMVAFADGHAGKRSPGALAIGTPFRFDRTGTNQSLATEITATSIDKTKYLWDVE